MILSIVVFRTQISTYSSAAVRAVQALFSQKRRGAAPALLWVH
jgi:hypothetical protein